MHAKVPSARHDLQGSRLIPNHDDRSLCSLTRLEWDSIPRVAAYVAGSHRGSNNMEVLLDYLPIFAPQFTIHLALDRDIDDCLPFHFIAHGVERRKLPDLTSF